MIMIRRAARGGSMMIEFALVVGVFVVLAMGVVEWGSYLISRAAVVGAVRAGASMAVATHSDGNYAAAATAVTQAALTAAGLNGSTAVVSVVLEGAAPSPVVVQVSVDYTPMVDVVPVPVTIQASEVMLMDR
jgi:Flp pilus assembly protein TadG